jgi:hypothetical protein
MIAALCIFTTGVAHAKLPVPQLTDEQKVKAEEAKAKAAETAKKESEMLGKSQDRVADRFIKEQKSKGVVVKPTPIAVAAAPAAVSSAPANPAAAPSPVAIKK